MTREEFCKYHWEYYLALENDLINVEKFVTFDLGDNNLYSTLSCTDYGNSQCFSNEFIKQYQSICSEIDVILKTICNEINSKSTAENMCEYTTEILTIWPEITEQMVILNDAIKLQPFINWSITPPSSPDWWSPYNKVKHNRISNYKKANLKNVLNSLAALYILEQYLARYIGVRDNVYDVPNDISKIFKMVNFNTKNHVYGRNQYPITEDEIDKIFQDF